MSLRFNKALKFLFVVLFSFEMMVPALISSVAYQDLSHSTRIASNERNFSNLISSLLCEESGEEEVESKGGKSQPAFISFDAIETYSLLSTTEHQHQLWTEPLDASKPDAALFVLFHSYLI